MLHFCFSFRFSFLDSVFSLFFFLLKILLTWKRKKPSKKNSSPYRYRDINICMHIFINKKSKIPEPKRSGK